MRAALVAIALMASSSAQAYEKKCEFVDDDGACNKMDSVSDIQLVKKGTPYAQLRQQMMVKGYQARSLSRAADRCIPELASNCREFPETVSCMAGGGADCQFVLYSNGVAFLVKTLSRKDGVQRLKSVHHMTIDEQSELEANTR